MFEICVLNQKVQGKVDIVTFLKLFLNAMIKNIKIQNILDIIRISKYMEPNKCNHKKNEKKFKCFL
jgi:hypothetical protein